MTKLPFTEWDFRYHLFRDSRNCLTRDERLAAWHDGTTPKETAETNDGLVEEYDNLMAEEAA